ncbi:MAG: hypothetical protein HUU18_02015 [Phycisphaerales bacterium]|nr:hypothetical protein [Phycisphaerales bacterium]
MTMTVLVTCLLIVLARVLDVSIGTLRTVMVVNARAWWAFFLGFVEVLIWITVVSRIITAMDHWLYYVAYAMGFALGNYIGISVEQRLAFGTQVLRVFSRKAHELATALRATSLDNDLPPLTVTEMEARGHLGPVGVLFLQVPRKHAKRVADHVVAIDPEAYYIIDDVRSASSASTRSADRLMTWRGLLNRK